MSFSYKKYIWHDPNCPAWHRNPKNNKPYPHLVKEFGDKYKCSCGYDADYEKICAFKQSKDCGGKNTWTQKLSYRI